MLSVQRSNFCTKTFACLFPHKSFVCSMSCRTKSYKSGRVVHDVFFFQVMSRLATTQERLWRGLSMKTGAGVSGVSWWNSHMSSSSARLEPHTFIRNACPLWVYCNDSWQTFFLKSLPGIQLVSSQPQHVDLLRFLSFYFEQRLVS